MEICGARAAAAAVQEEQGYDGLWTAETAHDPFFPLLLAVAVTRPGSSSAPASPSPSPGTR